jgi:hypothetical protein
MITDPLERTGMASNTDGEAQGEGRPHREARREFMHINERHDAALREASALFVDLMASMARLRCLPPEKEERFWTSIDSAVKAAAGLYDTAEKWGLGWVSEAEQGTVSRILHSASEDLAEHQRSIIGERLSGLWGAWTLTPSALHGVAPRPRPEVEALNLKNVAALALSLIKAEPGSSQAPAGGAGNPFEELSVCLSEHLGLPSFVLPDKRVTGERPILVSSLIDPRLAAAWVIKESSAELVPPVPELETLPATLQALCLAQEGLFADAALMGLIYAEDAAIVGLHREWKTLARALPDARERARYADDLSVASPAAQAQFGVYILSGEIEGTLERILPPAAKSRQRNLWWWACRFAQHYASGAGSRPDRLIHAEAKLRAETRAFTSSAALLG